MDRRIIFVKSLFEGVCPDPVEFTEPFANKSIERSVQPYLRATFDDHVHELNLDKTDWFFVYETKSKKNGTDFLTLLQFNFEQLVNSFFVV